MRVSIGLPFFNNEATLESAIYSVLAQSFQDWELILVDDGSEDRSLEIASSFRDSRIRLISDGKNEGLASRLNHITQLAQGDYLARMDGDDLMHPDRLAKQVSFLDNNPKVDFVATSAYAIDFENNILGLKSLEPIESDLKTLLVKKGLIIHPTVMGKREWFVNNPYDASLRFTEDRELWCRSCSYSNFAKIIEPLLFYRENFNKKSFLKKHLISFTINRDILRTYGYESLGKITTERLIFKTYVNVLIVYLLTQFNLYERAIRKNITPITQEEKQHAEKIIEGLEIGVKGKG